MLALTKVEYWQDKIHYRSYGLFCGQTPTRIAEQVVNWYGNKITDLNIIPIEDTGVILNKEIYNFILNDEGEDEVLFAPATNPKQEQESYQTHCPMSQEEVSKLLQEIRWLNLNNTLSRYNVEISPQQMPLRTIP